MADLVRRSIGSLVTSDAGPSKDPSSLAFTSNPLQQWWGIEQVPQFIINQFHQKSLFPTQLVLDELGTPETKNGQVTVAGWFVGTQSFTSFEISKSQSEPESSWQVKGKLLKFRSEAEVRKNSVPVDPTASAAGKTKVSPPGGDERLGSAHTLPAQLRRMLLSVSTPTFYYSQIWLAEPDFPASHGDFMRYTVPVVSINSNQLVAIHAEQRVEFTGGESKTKADKMICATAWETKVVRASI